MAIGMAGCATDARVDPTDAVFQVSLRTCTPDIENRATAVSIGDGLALTVAHSFDEAGDVNLVGPDDSELPATLVYLDRQRDIALLSFDPNDVAPETSEGLQIHSDADEPAEIGRVVVHREGTTTTVSVDLLRRTAVTLDGVGRRQGIELRGTIERGDSGAPVLDDRDRIIGMVFASSRSSDTGWAVAASELVSVKDEAGPPIPLSCNL